MKKLKFIALISILALIGGVAFSGKGFAEEQVDAGQQRGQANSIRSWFIARNARQDTTISADRVVVFDTISDDGVSVTTSTLSSDPLVVGVTMDIIPSITSNATAPNSSGTVNWGRVQIYGLHTAVSWDSGATACIAGSLVGNALTAGTASLFKPLSQDTTVAAISRDNFGFTTAACASTSKTMDIFIHRH